MENKSRELEVAIKAALEAGKVVFKYFEEGTEKVHKDNSEMVDVVTVADHEAEELIKKILSENFPDHSILGEETGMLEKGSEYIWYIDPIDGTANFSNRIPLFGVSIALAKNNELIAGVIHNPAARELFYAERGKGAYLNDKKIYVSKDSERTGIFTAGTSRTKENRQFVKNLVFDLAEKVRYPRNFGSSVIELSYVARGSTEAHIVTGLRNYDFAAGALLVLEAEGKIIKFDGTPWKFPDNYFIASNGVFHDLLVDEVKKQKEKISFKEI
ncbi:hypothetical protein A3D42_00600 [Candidatus Nomurabacteria bacterium RIFCSPHIGHO2_02_FULL_41_18]|uniref:Inositol-1-monophosphatase n=1 Tax=Candidatus Nomurabacteria bacterium RIFCSPHIGHO2_02_FULL_41_18 TaxID=1801754 RepID=A0A1F6W771_9BACT|nr:MAG: hypothetical protein A2737_02925 [Candidatus Nomurabacteria bacterium RIFCSPHIGHO2_01_FULL_41_71]OGI77787.1 MAG: hypothetical protein A3D42_00600 [Candidatus Nomurabacteria bacterium RIFCSPHIGHO2_02_FULL_41_18]OGI89947.1 MAG: hypothetical protein A3B01_01750 [Candidatus Nomurabacteria bacterium RIFCSPLOWO2_01_FULL_41_52b]OGJ00345.1 MAG: hypothetical protein A3I90_01290 [Candidatus Nomurabacteria bacterium RIFCSPLOWO2_02_FULL_41_9]